MKTLMTALLATLLSTGMLATVAQADDTDTGPVAARLMVNSLRCERYDSLTVIGAPQDRDLYLFGSVTKSIQLKHDRLVGQGCDPELNERIRDYAARHSYMAAPAIARVQSRTFVKRWGATPYCFRYLQERLSLRLVDQESKEQSVELQSVVTERQERVSCDETQE
jgi:hypothetical protein